MSSTIRSLLALLLALAPAHRVAADDPAADAEGYATAFRALVSPERYAREHPEVPIRRIVHEFDSGDPACDRAGLDAWIAANREALGAFDRATRASGCRWPEAVPGRDPDDGWSAMMQAVQVADVRLRAARRDAEGGRVRAAIEGTLGPFRLVGHLQADRRDAGFACAAGAIEATVDTLVRILGGIEPDAQLLAWFASELAGLPDPLVDLTIPTDRTCEALAAALPGWRVTPENPMTDRLSRFRLSMVGLEPGDPEAARPEFFAARVDEVRRAFDRIRTANRQPPAEALAALQALIEGSRDDVFLVRNSYEVAEQQGRCAVLVAVRVAMLRSFVALLETRARRGVLPASLAGIDAPTDPFTGRPFLETREEGRILLETPLEDGPGSRFRLALDLAKD